MKKLPELNNKRLPTLGSRIGAATAARKTIKRPLAFVEKAPDPMAKADIKPDDSNETILAKQMESVKIGIVERLKKDAARRKAATSADDFFTVVFESGQQATQFLVQLGYPNPLDPFIDGTILADLLQIKLPPAPKREVSARAHRDVGLQKLVTHPWKIGPKRS